MSFHFLIRFSFVLLIFVVVADGVTSVAVAFFFIVVNLLIRLLLQIKYFVKKKMALMDIFKALVH